MTLMMVLEEELDHAESTHYLVITILSHLDGFVDTKIGPVCQVRATCYLDEYGIEIQVPSMLKNGSFSWIVISRGPNRHVDGAWQDQAEPLQDVEMESYFYKR